MPRKGTTTPAGDPLRRALRGLLQVTVVQAGIQLYNAFALVDITVEQASALTIFLTPVLAFVQNWLEDNTPVPAMLKAPPSTGKKPVP